MRRGRKRSPLITIPLLLIGLFLAYQEGGWEFGQGGYSENSEIASAFASRQSNLQVLGEGEIIKLLPDDNKGSRHQKFIVRVPEGITILIAHNIDLAPRVPSPREGDMLEFYGEYEWTEKGGVVHWTHHDPAGRHPDGWLRYREQTYQ